MHKGVTTSTVEGNNGDSKDEEKMVEGVGNGIQKKVEFHTESQARVSGDGDMGMAKPKL